MISTFMLAGLVLAQQPQGKPQERPSQIQQELVTIQGRDFRVPHVPSDAKQAAREFRAANKSIASTMDILDTELAELYKHFPADELFRSFVMPRAKAELPEAKFLSSMMADKKIESFLDRITELWNGWQYRILEEGGGDIDGYANITNHARAGQQKATDRFQVNEYRKITEILDQPQYKKN
jgi:hypothetical protein